MRIRYPGAETRIKYPGGELQVRAGDEYAFDLRTAEEIIVEARVTSSDDLVGLLLLADAIGAVNPDAERILHIPYLPYARADRRFVPRDCHGLKTFGRIIRTAGFSKIVTLDVHNLEKAYSCVSSFLVNEMPNAPVAMVTLDYERILFPDDGALKRYGGQTYLPALSATKKRNPSTGALEGFTVPEIPKCKLLILDDICDGGGTFIGIAKALAESGFTGDLGLYVTHGIFSKGFDELRQYFSVIYTTNSFMERESTADLKVFDAFKLLG